MWWGQAIHYASKSDIGLRRGNNQDAFAVQVCSDEKAWENHGHLFLVADGMGGHAVGELASKIAADTVPHTFFKSTDHNITASLKSAIEQANANINERGTQNRDFERMGTTCTALVLSAQGAIIGHVGDSRLYRVRDKRLEQLTFDHSLHWELIRQRKMKPEDAESHESRHVITRSLGPEHRVQVDMEGPYPIAPGDSYLICSDGLTGHVSDQEIGMIVDGLSPADASRLLVSLANLRGGSDNVTVVIANVGGHPGGPNAVAPIAPKEPTHTTTWKWLGGFWMAAILFVLGISSMLFQRPFVGGALTVLSVTAATWLIYAWRLQHPKHKPVAKTGDETVLWRPYRTADARLTRGFLTHLASVEAELQRAANEEDWSINWKKHEQEFQLAKASLAAGEYNGALTHFSKVIDTLMAGGMANRHQAKHDQRWGKSTDS